MNRKLAGILLLLCFAAPVATTYLILQYQEKQLKREVKWKMIDGLDKSELVLLKFTAEESQTKLRWKHAKEFESDGQMYDIVEQKILGDTIYYWCWWDHEETKLNKKLDELVAFALGNNPQRKENEKQLTNFFKSLFWEQVPNLHFFTVLPKQKIPAYVASYLTISSSPPVPPPEIG